MRKIDLWSAIPCPIRSLPIPAVIAARELMEQYPDRVIKAVDSLSGSLGAHTGPGVLGLFHMGIKR